MSKEDVNTREVVASMSPVLYRMPEEDDISLVDLAMVIVRNRKIFYLISSLVFVIGLSIAVLIPKKYQYSTVIEVGNYQLPDNNGVLGKSQPVESTNRAKTKLEKRFVVEALQKYHVDNPGLSLPKIRIDAPKDSNILVVSTNSIEGDLKRIDLLNKIADELVRDHLLLSKDILEQLRQRVEMQVLKTEELNAKLEGDKQQIKMLSQNLLTLEEEVSLLGRQVKRTEKDIKELTVHRANYIEDDSKPKEALALLLIDNEIRQIREQRDALEYQLYIAAVDKKTAIEKKIEGHRAGMLVNRKAYENALQTLRRIGGETLLSTEENFSIEEQIDSFMNLRITSVAVEAYRSVDSVTLGQPIIMSLALFLGGFVGLIGCFFSEFVKKVRKESSGVS